MIQKIKDFFEPLNKISLAQITLAILLAFVLDIILSGVGVEGFVYVISALAIAIDFLVTVLDNKIKTLLSKIVSYIYVFLIVKGLSALGLIDTNATLTAIVAFGSTSILDSAISLWNKIFKKED